jgi:hypothetical protein
MHATIMGVGALVGWKIWVTLGFTISRSPSVGNLANEKSQWLPERSWIRTAAFRLIQSRLAPANPGYLRAAIQG